MRTAGPITPGPDLLAVFAALASVAKLDVTNAAPYAPTAHELDAATVADWERGLGIALPDDALVVMALKIPLFQRALGQLVGPVDAPDVDDAKWVGVWSADPHAMHPLSEESTYQRVADLTLFLEIKPTAGEPRLLIVSSLEEEARPRTTTLSAFLRRRLDEYFAEREDEDLSQAERAEIVRRHRAWKASRSVAAGDADPLYAAAIVGEAKPAFAPIRVTHPKLGEGTIVGLFEDKADVVFDSGDRKKIKREFLKDG